MQSFRAPAWTNIFLATSFPQDKLTSAAVAQLAKATLDPCVTSNKAGTRIRICASTSSIDQSLVLVFSKICLQMRVLRERPNSGFVNKLARRVSYKMLELLLILLHSCFKKSSCTIHLNTMRLKEYLPKFWGSCRSCASEMRDVLHLFAKSPRSPRGSKCNMNSNTFLSSRLSPAPRIMPWRKVPRVKRSPRMPPSTQKARYFEIR
mmetsp:Transcript_121715/g.303690  ORF Transcript_121715/g.303690 Transcript_121715/m.303690 type:complete len:206 (+) Transcript_121715:698-1315(+)